jgi:hypothetical protein
VLDDRDDRNVRRVSSRGTVRSPESGLETSNRKRRTVRKSPTFCASRGAYVGCVAAVGFVRKLNARLENGAPEYPANTNCDAAKAIPPGAMIRRPLAKILETVAAGIRSGKIVVPK